GPGGPLPGPTRGEGDDDPPPRTAPRGARQRLDHLPDAGGRALGPAAREPLDRLHVVGRRERAVRSRPRRRSALRAPPDPAPRGGKFPDTRLPRRGQRRGAAPARLPPAVGEGRAAGTDLERLRRSGGSALSVRSGSSALASAAAGLG